VTRGSSLPPLKTNDSKYGLLALLLLLAAFGLWFFLRSDETEPERGVERPPDAPTREQFAPEIEIPEEDAGTDDEPAARRRKRSQSKPADIECFGTLAPAQIALVINGQPRKQVQACYERRLKDDNLLQGSMTVLITIGSAGSVTDVSISGTLRDRKVYSCVKRVAKTWKFPKPQGGCVQTAIPFQMTPKL
jgi:outer membrane biosynthesis protein TonB